MNMGIYDLLEGGSKQFDKAAWAAKKQNERQAAFELADTTAEKMKGDSGLLRTYLNVQAHFDRYSVTNAILVTAQMPGATTLKDWQKWKADGVTVDRTAKKISILEPGNEFNRHDGTRGIGFNAKTVYDISDTSAKNTVAPREQRSLRELAAALIEASPVAFQTVDELGMPAYYDFRQQKIFVNKGLDEQHLFAGMAKEIAAAVFDFKLSRGRDFTEFQSYCVAYMLCKKNGVAVDGFDFSTLPSEYADMDTNGFKSELGDIRSVLSEIHGAMYKSMEKAQTDKSPKPREQQR